MASESDRRESPGVATYAVLGASLGFLLFVAVGLWAIELYYRHVVNPEAVPEATVSPPPPRLQTDPKADLADL